MDVNGLYYQKNTEEKLGKLQTTPNHETGFVALLLDNDGNITDRIVKNDADRYVTVPKEELGNKNKLFVSDLMSLGSEDIFAEADKLLSSAHKLFALNIGGAHPRFGSAEDIRMIVKKLRKKPDIVFGNQAEFNFLSGNNLQDSHRSIPQLFHNSSLVVMTMAERGAVVRFNDDTFRVDAVEVSKENIVDETGAGDCYEGTMLAYLYSKPYSEWNVSHMKHAARAAAFASSLIVQTERTRLSFQDVLRIRTYSDTTNYINGEQ